MNPFYKPYWEMDNDNQLNHFGILGMKWGFRRFQNKDGSLTAAGKARYRPQLQVPKDAEPTKIMGQSYAEDIKIPAGSTAYRVQSGPTLKKGSQLYLTFDKNDHANYLDLALNHPDYGVAIDLQTPGKPIDYAYSVTMKNKKPIKAPSYQNAMETFVEMIGEIGIDEINPSSKECLDGQWFIESIKTSNIDDLGPDYAYKRFVDTMRKPSRSEFYKDFTKRLSKNGYNALVDPVDRAYEYDPDEEGMLSAIRAPFIVFDPSVMEVTSAKKMSYSKYRGGV